MNADLPWYLWVLIGYLIWFIVGCIVLGGVDDRQELLNWVQSAPPRWRWFAWYVVVGIFWPIMVYLYCRGKTGRKARWK